MKSAKPSAADAQSHRRSQPVRQTRTNPPRSSANAARSSTARDPLGGAGLVGEQAIDIFPAITHFADAITSLPKELVRHFTLLKEVEAKIFAPEEQLFKLVAAARSLPVPEPRTSDDASRTMARSGSAPAMSAREHPSSGMRRQNATGEPNGAAFDPSNLQRRQLFRQTAFKIQEMLVSLEEKNHVISTANEALQRQLTRVQDVWPHLKNEFSDEAKWGSTTHWAYPENRNGRSAQAERIRRDGAAAISAAAQALSEQAASRSDARKQAVQAKRTQKPQAHESDADDVDRGKESGRKSQPSKVRKAAETNNNTGNIHNQNNQSSNHHHPNHAGSNNNISSSSSSNNNKNNNNISNSISTLNGNHIGIGLGISTAAATASNGNPPQKRRKVEKEKPQNGAAVAAVPERVMSGVGAVVPKIKPAEGDTPVAEPPKKRKALPTSSGQSKKRNGASAMSPSTTSFPVLPVLVEPSASHRPSPPTSAPARPPSSRARQNSVQSNSEATRIARPPSAVAANKTNGNMPSTPELAQLGSWPRPVNDPRPVKDSAVAVEMEVASGEAGYIDSGSLPTPVVTGGRRESKVAVAAGPTAEEADPRSEALPPSQQNNGPATAVTTKSGRASKPSTPALPSAFPEPVRSRTTRNADPTSHGGSSSASSTSGSGSGSGSTQGKKMAQKKGGAAQATPREKDEEEDEDGEIDADEPTYCYCNSVSYGEMVACDSDDCAREWFHLACVGLKVAPSSKTKWYCEDCKERLKMGGKKTSR